MQVSSECRENCKAAITATLRAHPGTSREELIGLAFEFLDGCLSELISEGQVTIEHNTRGESHMDVLVAVEMH